MAKGRNSLTGYLKYMTFNISNNNTDRGNAIRYIVLFKPVDFADIPIFPICI